MCETHLTKDIDEQEITLKRYDNIGSMSTSSRTGGVIVHCKKNWNVKKFIERTDELKYWILFCKAVRNDNNHNTLIGAIYRLPSYSEAEFRDIFGEIIEKLSDYNNCDILIARDFNIDWKNYLYKNRIKNTFNNKGVKQIANVCTHVTRNSSTVNYCNIVYVITNSYKVKCTNSRDNKISDHEVINIDFEISNENFLKTTKPSKYLNTIRIYLIIC